MTLASLLRFGRIVNVVPTYDFDVVCMLIRDEVQSLATYGNQHDRDRWGGLIERLRKLAWDEGEERLARDLEVAQDRINRAWKAKPKKEAVA